MIEAAKNHIIEITIVVVVVVYFCARWKTNSDAMKQRHEDAKDLFDTAKAIYESGDFILAATKLAESLGHSETSEAYELLGCAMEKLKKYDAAAKAFTDASWLQRKGPGALYSYYCYRAAKSHASEGNWEFAFLRAQGGIEVAENHSNARFVDGEDWETYLREVRMIAALHHLKGTEAFETARADANWILANSKNGKQLKLAKSIAELKDVVPDIATAIDSDASRDRFGNN